MTVDLMGRDYSKTSWGVESLNIAMDGLGLNGRNNHSWCSFPSSIWSNPISEALENVLASDEIEDVKNSFREEYTS